MFQCSKAFPEIYVNTKMHLFTKEEHQVFECYGKIYSDPMNWKNANKIYSEIKYFKKLAKNSSVIPQVCYYSCAISPKNIILGTEYGGLTFREFMHKNQDIGHGDMKIIFYNIVKAFHYLKEKSIVHNDIKPENIIVKSPEIIKIIDFGNSYKKEIKYESSAFPKIRPSIYATELFLSPELMTQRKLHDKIRYILCDPFKSDVFSLGLCFLDVCGINIQNLNCFGLNYDEFIKSMLTVNYDYIAKDSLKRHSYRLIREELQKAIDDKIKEFPYDFLNDSLRKMLEVDIVERATIDDIYKDAKYHMGIFD